MIKLQPTIHTNLLYTEGYHLKHYISLLGTQVNSYKYNFLLLILKQHLQVIHLIKLGRSLYSLGP